jgi:acetyl-CoA synthetase
LSAASHVVDFDGGNHAVVRNCLVCGPDRIEHLVDGIGLDDRFGRRRFVGDGELVERVEGSRDGRTHTPLPYRNNFEIIITAGYRVGPGEVESAILEHPAVEQIGVVGVPDETPGEIIKAFVQPVSEVTGDDALREEIRDLVRGDLAQYEYPREIEFLDELPQTTTEKIQRRKLRDREGEV